MKRIAAFAAAALLVAVPALAGSGEKCKESTQACLNHWAQGKDKGWLGLKYDKAEDGSMVVKSVMENSPAATAGFQVGDVLVAMNGAKMSDQAAMKKAKGEWKVGQEVTYMVTRSGAEQTIGATLVAMPEEVFASMLGSHMLENHVKMATATSYDAKAGTKDKK